MARSRGKEISLFQSLLSAMKKLVARDSELFLMKKSRVPILSLLSSYLREDLPATIHVDLLYPLSEKCPPDILVHDRKGKVEMAIYLSDDYLEKKTRENAKAFSSSHVCLTVALSILPEKDYFLIYRFTKEYTDYLHYDRETFTEEVIKRSEAKDDESMMLFPSKKRGRKKKESGEDKPLSDKL